MSTRLSKRRAALACLSIVAATGLDAAELYKSTMPDGRIVYGEKPAPGAKRVDTLEEPPAQSGILTVTPEDKARASRIPSPSGPSVTIIPQRQRPPVRSIEQGGLQNPTGDLPKPAEY